jgi:hypothetical protein
VVAGLAGWPGDTRDIPAGPGPVPTAVPTATDVVTTIPLPVFLGADPVEDPAHAQQRLVQALMAALAREAPGASLDQPSLTSHRDVEIGQQYSGTFMVHVGGRNSLVSVTISRGRQGAECGLVVAEECARFTAGSGTVIANARAVYYEGTDPQQIEFIATALRPDGTLVEVRCRNQSGLLENDPATSYLPVLTSAQLGAIASDPAFTLYP